MLDCFFFLKGKGQFFPILIEVKLLLLVCIIDNIFVMHQSKLAIVKNLLNTHIDSHHQQLEEGSCMIVVEK